MRHLRVGTILAVALALGACGQTSVVSHYSHVGILEQFSFVAGHGSVRTVVIGNPFPEDKPTVERTITETFRDRHYGPKTEFTTGPGHPKTRDYRIVLLFNPAQGLSPKALCGDVGALAADGSAGGLRVMAAFCYGGTDMSFVLGSAGPARSVRDPQVADLLGQVLLNLIPVDEPFEFVAENIHGSALGSRFSIRELAL